MATRDLGEEAPLPVVADQRPRRDRNGAYGPASVLEIGLAACGVAAWLWCAYEVLSAVI
jgi:hypothetical protein